MTTERPNNTSSLEVRLQNFIDLANAETASIEGSALARKGILRSRLGYSEPEINREPGMRFLLGELTVAYSWLNQLSELFGEQTASESLDPLSSQNED